MTPQWDDFVEMIIILTVAFTLMYLGLQLAR
jgi:hypothetical protein